MKNKMTEAERKIILESMPIAEKLLHYTNTVEFWKSGEDYTGQWNFYNPLTYIFYPLFVAILLIMCCISSVVDEFTEGDGFGAYTPKAWRHLPKSQRKYL